MWVVSPLHVSATTNTNLVVGKFVESVEDDSLCAKRHAAYWDEISGQPLPELLVRTALREELGLLADWEVWDERVLGCNGQGTSGWTLGRRQ